METELSIAPVPISLMTQEFECRLLGDNILISKFGNLSSRTNQPEMQLSYVTSKRFLEHFNNSMLGACIIHESLIEFTSPAKSYLVTAFDPEELFYSIFMLFVNRGLFPRNKERTGLNNYISSKAIIHDSVQIGDDCIIMDNVVLMPNTVIGNRVTIKPNTVIGGDGFQVKDINGKRKVIPHQGGVEICDDVEIGSGVTIDKGLFGEYTIIESEVKVDNLVHIAHSALVGKRSIIAAGAIIAGGVVIGEHVWLGIKSSVNQLLVVDDYSFVGASTAVVKTIRPHEKVFGVPARRIGYLCTCRHDLEQNMNDNMWYCPNCGSKYYF